MTFRNDFSKVTVQSKFSSSFWVPFKPFQGGKLGWFSNSEVQRLPEGTVFREKGIRLMPERILLWASCFIIILQCAATPWHVLLSVFSWPLQPGWERTTRRPG